MDRIDPQNEKTFILKLDPEKRWEYLERYYDLAKRFYNLKDCIISDEEVASMVSGLKEKPAPKIRKEISLTDWKFTMDLAERGTREGYFLHEYNEDSWEDIVIPHAFQYVPEDPIRYGRSDYAIYAKGAPVVDIWRGDATAWYKTRPYVEEFSYEEQVAYLNVESANLRSDIWFNDYPVMMDHIGLFPYKVEVSEALRALYTADPVVAIRIGSTASNMPHMFYNGFQFAYSDERYAPGGRDKFDWLDLVSAGLADEVTLSILNKNHIDSVFIHTKKLFNRGAQVAFDITLRNQTRSIFHGDIEIEISPWSAVEAATIYQVKAVAKTLPMNDNLLHVEVEMADPKRWTPKTPGLYLAHIVLKDENGAAIDDIYEIFGVRTFEINGSHFYLNGKKTVLRGVHESSHYHDEIQICPSHEIVAKSLLLQKEMGANCARWPSDVRMHNKKIAQYCDQYGLMLSWSGFFDIWTLHPDVEMLSQRDVKAVVTSLRNHPCIISWEMGDEAMMWVQEHRRLRYAEKMYDWVYEADYTRPIIPTGDWTNDLARYIHDYPDDSLTIEEKRERVLEEYPLFDRDLAVWDIHILVFPDSLLKPHELAASWRGRRPSVFTEFGFDSYPDPENIKDIADEFKWIANPFCHFNKEAMDLRFFGREIREQDWKVTQSLHALITSSVINVLRQYPKEFAAYYFLALFDLYTYHYGSVDALGNGKLPYFTVKNHYDEIFLSAFHGDIVIKSGDVLRVTASNYADDVKDGSLKIIMRDKADKIVHEEEVIKVYAPGDVSLTEVAKIIVPKLVEGLYSLEYYLTDQSGQLLGRMMELAYLEV